MNLIELENLVKGAPDEYIVKEVQQPTGKVPPFLALSEIQRRKDMRDRYLAQTNEAPKPTIAEQLVGGIGSMGGAQPPQGAPIPTPSATGIPSAGAPPVAAGAAPMPTPQGMPQGFAAGGIVKMAAAGQVPASYQARYPLRYGIVPPPDPTIKRIDEIKAKLAQNDKFFNPFTGNRFGSNLDSEERAALESEIYKLENSRTREGIVTPAVPAVRPTTPAAVPAEASVPAPVSNRPGPLPAPAGGAGGAPRPSGTGGYAVAPVGIGSIDPNQAIAGSAPSGGQAPAAGMPNPYNLSEPELAYEQYMKNDENFKLPEALSYQAFIDEAMGEEQKIREEAKRQAIGAALVQLGAGLAAGDMSKGFTTAGAESRDILSQGRREASAQKALAQQFKLQGMQGEREQQIKMLEIEQQRVMALANFAGGNRKDAEARAMQIMEMKQRAADRAANLSVSLAGQEMTRDRYALEAKKDRLQLRSELLRATIGDPPSAKVMADYEQEYNMKVDPKTKKPKEGVPLPRNPMTVYRQLATQVAPEIERQVAEVYGGTGYTPVAPVSNPPKDYTGFELLGTQNPKK